MTAKQGGGKGLFNEFLKYISLSITGMVGLSVFILADTFFVSDRMGTLGLAALNLALPAYGVLNGLGMLLGMGGATRYTLLSKRNDPGCRLIFTHTLIAGGVLSAVFMVLGLTATRPISYMLGADSQTIELTFTYLRMILIFAPAFIFSNILMAFLRNDRSPRLAMAGMLAASGLNITLDYIFMYPLGLGMLGGALATGLATSGGVVLMLVHFKGKHNSLRLVKTAPGARDIAKIAMPGMSAFVSEASMGIVLIVFNLVILRLKGSVGVAAFAIITNLAFVAVAVFNGLAQGLQPLVSKAFGGRDYRAANKLLGYGLVFALGIAAVIYAAVNIFAPFIISVYNGEGDEVLAAIAAQGIKIYFIGYFLAGFNFVIAAYLSATTSAAWGMAVSFIKGLAAIAPMVIILSYLAGMTGVWVSFAAAEALALVFALLLLFFSGKKTAKAAAEG